MTEAELRPTVVFARRWISLRPVVFGPIRTTVASPSPDFLRPPSSQWHSLPTGSARFHADPHRTRIEPRAPGSICFDFDSAPSASISLTGSAPPHSTSARARLHPVHLQAAPAARLQYRPAQLLIYGTGRPAAPLQWPNYYSTGRHQPIRPPW
jgi:hypothetical protein